MATTFPTTPALDFVHTAPGHGREDFEVWMDNKSLLDAAGIDTISLTPSTRMALSPSQVPGFTGKRVLNDKGEKGDANEAVIKALAEGGMLIARRAAQTSVSAFLALEEASDLSQHAAMVHRDGQANH